jgi:hypothetical protein
MKRETNIFKTNAAHNLPLFWRYRLVQSQTSRNFDATDQCSPRPSAILTLEINVYKQQFSDKSLAIVTLQTNAAQDLFLL